MDEKLYEIIKEEREKSDRDYAVKLVEKIVFAMVGIICVAVAVALLKQINL